MRRRQPIDRLCRVAAWREQQTGDRPGRVTAIGRVDGMVRFATGRGLQRESGCRGRVNVIRRGDGMVRVATGRSSQRGYTLLEIIVAFAVLGLALTLLLGTLSGSTRQVRWAADSGRAALHAQSLLDETGVGEVLKPGRRAGEFEGGRYRWVLDVAPHVDRSRPPPRTVDAFAPQLLQLQLTVLWGEGGPRERLQLQSLRLVQPDMSGTVP